METTPQRRRRLTRALLVPLALALVATTVVLGSRVLAVRQAGDAGEQVRSSMQQPWRDAYSRRFPHCVAAVLWPADRAPEAVVVRWRSGRLERVPLGPPLRRALDPARGAGGRVIGACYR